jgi:hypothetical protein
MKTLILDFKKNVSNLSIGLLSKTIILPVFFILVNLSCEGEEGPAGKDGNANVFASAWAPTTLTGSGTLWTGTITAPQITQPILDSGVVITYTKVGGTVYPLTYVYTVGSSQQVLAAIYNLGEIKLECNINVSLQYRYVVIPSNASASSKIFGGTKTATLNGKEYTEAQLKKLPYDAVCNALGIAQ